MAALIAAARVSARQSGAAAECKTTDPNGVVAGVRARSQNSYGNAHVSVDFWPGGTITFRPDGPGFVTRKGELGMKFLWRRSGTGKLDVSGRRLDGAAPPLRAQLSPNADAAIEPSYLIFPTPGCWEVTARLGGREDSRLTFVTRVVKIGDGPAWRL